MPTIDRDGQNWIAPYVWLLTVIFWCAAWMEIISHGKWHLHFDCAKYYLAVVGAYAGAAEFSKWSVDIPTNSQDDPATERLHRGMFFIWLWTAPFLCALLWQIKDETIPLPSFVEKIPIGLVIIYLAKHASRHFRRQKHGFIADDGTEVAPSEPALETVVFQKVSAAQGGMLIGEIIAATPDTSRPTIYRALDKLVKTRRLTRTGKPRTPEVRYKAVGK